MNQTLCFLEGQWSRIRVLHSHVDRFAGGKLQARGRGQAGLAVFPQTEPSFPVLQRGGVITAEEGKDIIVLANVSVTLSCVV